MTDLDGSVCIANIGPGQRRRRHRLGVGSLTAAGVLAAGAWGMGLSSLWIVPAAGLAFGGFAGVLQAREKT